MALPFLTLELDEERKFRFTLGDMAELQEWAKSKTNIKAEDGQAPGMDAIFAEMGADFDVLTKMLWLGMRHFIDHDDTVAIEEKDIAGLIHMGAVPDLIMKVSSFIVSTDGKAPPKNLPRPATRTIPKKQKAGTGKKSSKPPAA